MNRAYWNIESLIASSNTLSFIYMFMYALYRMRAMLKNGFAIGKIGTAPDTIRSPLHFELLN